MEGVETVSASIGVLREQREKAQYAAALLKRMQQQGKLSEIKYTQGVSYYVKAKGAVDGWLDRLLSELETGGGRELSTDHQHALEHAGVTCLAFLNYVAALGEDQSRGVLDELAKIFPDAVKALVDAGIKLWGEVRPTPREAREALIKRIEALRWLSFDQISAAS
jgi:hypothetical protein